MNKTFIWILVVVIIIIGGIYLSGSKKATETNPITNPAAEQPASLKTADGSIDNAVASVLFEANADVQAPAETNSSLTAPENFNGLDQALDTSGVK